MNKEIILKINKFEHWEIPFINFILIISCLFGARAALCLADGVVRLRGWGGGGG